MKARVLRTWKNGNLQVSEKMYKIQKFTDFQETLKTFLPSMPQWNQTYVTLNSLKT